MARVENFVYCLNAERIPVKGKQGDTINAMGVLSVISPEFIPGSFSFSIVFSILGMDLNNTNQIRIQFKDDSQKVLIDTDNLSIPPMSSDNEMHLPKEYCGLNLSMDFRNVVFERDGLYNTVVMLNEEIIGSAEIYAKGRRNV